MPQRHQPAPPSFTDRPLRIGLLSYRSNPHSGGQGVYIQHLSRALKHLGHTVTVISGPPWPELDDGIRLVRLPSLDLYNPADLFRTPSWQELKQPVNLVEWLSVSSMGFPEPFTFGWRAFQYLRRHRHTYDILHDNQSLSYGIGLLARRRPLTATIHHPITVDRRIAIRTTASPWKKLQHWRWYSFIGMQKRVARRLPQIITVSDCARRDISREFGIPPHRFVVVPNGIDMDRFHPLEGTTRRPGRMMVTNSADIPLKGLYYLLQAIARLQHRPELHLVVIGQPRENGGIVRLIQQLGIGPRVTFTGRISHAALIQHYAEAALAVVPSVYEGFGLPAGEAMACGVPLISTTGGALPEVVGDAGLLVPPANTEALARAIETLLDNPQEAARLGVTGRQRVRQHFTWEIAARKTVAAYGRVLGSSGQSGNFRNQIYGQADKR